MDCRCRYTDSCAFGADAEDLGLQILSPTASFETPPMPVVFSASDDSTSGSAAAGGIALAGGATSSCEYCEADPDTCKKPQYCQALTTAIYASDRTSPPVNATVTFSASASCASGTVKATLNVHSAADAKYPKKSARPALTLPLRGACGATITLDARRLEKPWHRLTVTNEGEALTDLIVYAALSNE